MIADDHRTEIVCTIGPVFASREIARDYLRIDNQHN